MSIKSKIAAIAAASLGMVLTQSSAPRAETEDDAPEKVTKIATPIDVDEVFYSALPDEVLERAAAGDKSALCGNNTGGMSCASSACNTQVKKPPLGAPKGGTGLTVPPKPAQGNKNK